MSLYIVAREIPGTSMWEYGVWLRDARGKTHLRHLASRHDRKDADHLAKHLGAGWKVYAAHSIPGDVAA